MCMQLQLAFWLLCVALNDDNQELESSKQPFCLEKKKKEDTAVQHLHPYNVWFTSNKLNSDIQKACHNQLSA